MKKLFAFIMSSLLLASCANHKQTTVGITKEQISFPIGQRIENVIYLPDENIHGNSHFMFQEKNNAEIADLIGEWLKKHNL